MVMRQIARMGVLVALLVCPARAKIINGSFETGDFTGWRTEALHGWADVVPGGTDGDWVARLNPRGYYIGGGGFLPDEIVLVQDFVVPAWAAFLLFDAWVEEHGIGEVYLGHFMPGPDVRVDSSSPKTYAISLEQLQPGSETWISFLAKDTDTGENAVLIDNVRLAEIPEVCTVLMFLSGCSAVAARAARRVL